MKKFLTKIVLYAFFIFFIGNGIGIDVKEILTSNFIGQAILFITGILYLFVTVKLFGTDK